MLRLRLNVPLHFYLNANDPSLLSPSLTFTHGSATVLVSLRGGPPPRVTTMHTDEPDFRTVSRCQIEIRDEGGAVDLSKWINDGSYSDLIGFAMPIVNRTLRAIRNFGWVTTAREYKPEDKAELLLRAWQARARLKGRWTEVAPKPKKGPFESLFDGLELDENVEKGSLSVARWADIEQALNEDLTPNPEDEFLTNALQHLRDSNFRLALIGATVCLEIVLSQCLNAHLQVRRHFSQNKIDTVLNNVGLTSRVGLVLDLILTPTERQAAKLDSVLRAIKWRNKIIHDTGHIPHSVPPQEVSDSVYAMLNLALKLADRREKMRCEPETQRIAQELSEKLNSPTPTVELLKHHKVEVRFSYLKEGPLFLRRIGMASTPTHPAPDEVGMRQTVDEVILKLIDRDSRFDPAKHLSVVFEWALGNPFAFFENGDWKYLLPGEDNPSKPREVDP